MTVSVFIVFHHVSEVRIDLYLSHNQSGLLTSQLSKSNTYSEVLTVP